MEKIILDKSVFEGRDGYIRREKEIEVPELNSLMKVGKGGVVIVKIKQIDLDTYLNMSGDIIDQQRNLIEGIVEAASDKGLVRDETLKSIGKSTPLLRHRLKIVEKGLVSPKLKMSDILWISKMFPFAITKIANEIILLTEQGAVKKNSPD